MEDNTRQLEIQKVITEHTSATTTEMAEISLSDIPRLAEEIHKLYFPIKPNFINDFKYEEHDIKTNCFKTYCFDYVGDMYTNDEGHRVGSLHTEYVRAFDEEHAILIFEKLHPFVSYDKPY